MGDFERRALLAILWPVLWLQARYVRRVTPRMPEACGARQGTCGQGPRIRLLIAGDSGAAGVGVKSQRDALCGQLVQHLSQKNTVEWLLLAANGLDSPGLFKLIHNTPANRFDVVVLSMGANDATGLCPPRKWLRWQNLLALLICARFEPNLLVHSAVPPMHACAALPQPLRWFIGRWALEMNRLLAKRLCDHVVRSVHWHPATTPSVGLAMDGFHPSRIGYALWAEGLSKHILADRNLQTADGA